MKFSLTSSCESLTVTASGTKTRRPTVSLPKMNSNSFQAKWLLIPIGDEDLSNDPFRFTDNIVYPQPFQLSELYMDDCMIFTS